MPAAVKGRQRALERGDPPRHHYAPHIEEDEVHGAQRELSDLLRQDAGTPVPADTPPLGEQPDGTHLWRVRVAGMDEENLIDTQVFFPKELTINAGDAVLFEFPTPPGFHTVTFLSGQDVPALIIPDEAAGTPAASPPAGPPTLIINPMAAFPSGATTTTARALSIRDSTSFGCPAIRRSCSRLPRRAPMNTSASRMGW